jgi:hypothetical protein
MKSSAKKIIAHIIAAIIILSAAAVSANASDLNSNSNSSSNGEVNMLKNGNFEKGRAKTASDWSPWNNGNSGDTETAYIEGALSHNLSVE